MAVDTLYDLLGIPAASTTEEIRSAYRKLSKVYHPDLGGRADFFRQLQEGYEILTDPMSRAAYDRSLAMSVNHRLLQGEETGSRGFEQESSLSPRSDTAPPNGWLLATWSRGVDSLAVASQARRRHDIVSATWIISVILAGVVVGTLLEATHGLVLFILVIMAIFAWRSHESTKRQAQRRERAAKAAVELNRTAMEAAERRRTSNATPMSRRGTSSVAAGMREKPDDLKCTDPIGMTGERGGEGGM